MKETRKQHVGLSLPVLGKTDTIRLEVLLVSANENNIGLSFLFGFASVSYSLHPASPACFLASTSVPSTLAFPASQHTSQGNGQTLLPCHLVKEAAILNWIISLWRLHQTEVSP